MARNNSEQLMRAEGFVNPEDLFDQPTWQEIAFEIEKEDTIVEFVGSVDSLTKPERETLKELQNFLKQVSVFFRREMLRQLKDYSENHRAIPKKILDFLMEKKFTLPIFRIYSPVDFQKTLNMIDPEFSFEDFSDEFLVVFDFPKPLSFFWFKGYGGLGGKKIEGAAIDWGKFYENLSPVIWQAVDYQATDKGLEFTRINAGGYHRSGSFYYIWSVKSYD